MTMVSSVRSPESFLGVGIYTPAEAAVYARLHPQTLTRWVYGSKSGSPAIRAQFPPEEEKVITFLDLIQSLAIRAIRTTRKVPLSKIREAVTKLEDRYGKKYPFARPHETFLLGDEVFIDLKQGGFVQVTGRMSGQHAMKRVVEAYLTDLSYGADGLAIEYSPFSFGGHRILLNPHQMFGEPVVESCRYTARTLWEAAHSEGSFEAAAKAFGVKAVEVEAGFRYFDTLIAA
jgi:uncharacterized protein (DUF433 family)